MTKYDCPKCGNGKLKAEFYKGKIFGYRCDGLMDPDHDDLELLACDCWVERLPKSYNESEKLMHV